MSENLRAQAQNGAVLRGEGREAPPWVRPSDRLPEHEAQVVVAIAGGLMCEAVYLAPRGGIAETRYPGGFVSPVDGDRFIQDVVCWAPFPALPEWFPR